MTEKKTTYSLIAYKSSSDCSHRGCHRASYSSTCIHESGLSPEDLQDRIAELKATELDCCEGGYENIWWFEDPANLDLGVAFEDGIAEKTATILAEHKAKKDQKAADEKHRAQAQADARERAEFERLKTKFTPKEVVRP
jgi:hypothetical protein